MTRARMAWATISLLLLAMTACERALAPDPAEGPPAELAKRAVLALLPGLQFGPDPAQDAYREIRAADVAGAHFVPGANRWVVHYCVDFTNFASDAQLRRCDVSVEVYELDTKKWVGFARGMGTLYRWQVLEPDPKSAASAESERGSPAP